MVAAERSEKEMAACGASKEHAEYNLRVNSGLPAAKSKIGAHCGHYLLQLQDLRRSDGLPSLVKFLQKVIAEDMVKIKKKRSATSSVGSGQQMDLTSKSGC